MKSLCMMVHSMLVSESFRKFWEWRSDYFLKYSVFRVTAFTTFLCLSCTSWLIAAPVMYHGYHYLYQPLEWEEQHWTNQSTNLFWLVESWSYLSGFHEFTENRRDLLNSLVSQSYCNIHIASYQTFNIAFLGCERLSISTVGVVPDEGGNSLYPQCHRLSPEVERRSEKAATSKSKGLMVR